MKEEIEVNAKGGAGSRVPMIELVDARAIREIAEVFTYGATKYQPGNWKAVSVEEHLRHAILHAYSYLEHAQQYRDGKPSLEELSHFACRAVMALAVHLQDAGVEDKCPKGVLKKSAREAA